MTRDTRRIEPISQSAQQISAPRMSAREAMRRLVTGKIGHVARGGVDGADTHHGEADRPDVVRDTDPIEPGHRGGAQRDPAAAVRRPCRGFVDLDRHADLSERERGSRTADTASDHHRAHARPTLPRPFL
ncbi:MAG: hypothetical protein WAN20_11445 [Pseudonocardiaceae bacterium]